MKKNLVSKRLIVGLACFALFGLICLGAFSAFNKLSPTRLHLQYGDEMKGVRLFDAHGSDVVLDDDTYHLFVLSTTCGPCMETLPMLSLMEKSGLFHSENVILVWGDDIPIDKLERHGLDQFSSVSLKKRVELYSSTPYYLTINQEKVSFATSDFEQMLKYMIITTDYDEKDLMNVYHNILGENVQDGVLIFEQEDCEACMAIDDEYLNQVGVNNYLIVSNAQKENAIYDKYGFLSKLFHIDTYPSSLIYKETGFVKSILGY